MGEMRTNRGESRVIAWQNGDFQSLGTELGESHSLPSPGRRFPTHGLVFPAPHWDNPVWLIHCLLG